MSRFIAFAGIATTLALVLIGCGGSDCGLRLAANPFAGNYSGTYSGDESGTWVASVNDSGVVTASIYNSTLGTFTGTGTMSETGSMSLTTTGSGSSSGVTITWVGSFSTSGGSTTGSGTWTSTAGDNGTWIGRRD